MDLSQKDLIRWHDAASPRRQDVLGDFAGRELCAIHGESLLMYCLAGARVDFKGGFQLLHAIHAVELFLSKLRIRGCKFHVLWFDDHESLLQPPVDHSSSPETQFSEITAFDKRRLARAILIAHLERYGRQATPPTEQYFRFQSTKSSDFAAYCHRNLVRLFFVSDGQSASMCDSMLMDHVRGEHPKPNKRLTFYESIIFNLTNAGYTVGLLDDIEFHSSEIQATLFSATRGLFSDIPCWSIPSIWKSDTEWHTDLMQIKETIIEMAETEASSEKESLTFCDLASCVVLSGLLMKNPGMEMQRRSAALLTHRAIITHTTLSSRPTEAYSCPDLKSAMTDSDFVRAFCTLSIDFIESCGLSANLQWDGFDLMDGRLWASVFKHLGSIVLPVPMGHTFRKLSALVLEASGIDLSAVVNTALHSSVSICPSPPRSDASHTLTPVRGSLLPFRQPDFKQLLEGVAITVLPAEDYEQAGDRPYGGASMETTHWHSTKKLSSLNGAGVVEHPASLRRNQRRMAEMVNYAASLTNAVGKVLDPEIIVTANKSLEVTGRPARNTSTTQRGTTSGTKNQDLARKVKLRKSPTKKEIREKQAEARLQATQHDELEKATAGWKFAFANFCKIQDTLKRYSEVAQYIKVLSPIQKKLIGPDALLFACSILATLYVSNSGLVATIGLDIMALVWVHTQELKQLPLSRTMRKTVSKFFKCLGLPFDFPEIPSPEHLLGHEQPLLSKDAFTTLPEILKKRKALSLESPIEFQLGYCGPYLERGFDSQPDPRVSNFNPDGWQRQVLDTIDKRDSLFVVAPTSAGKTFISFYAMKQVLQESSNGVLIYIAPTKAICNQVAADIQARFSKSYSVQTLCKCVWGIKTRDVCINNPTSCQILVTVPHMLQILLLSPSSSVEKSKHSWTSRIKWIIFDEVHSIGQTDGGVIWEQLLLMAPCPLIALSATVGNPHEFQHWLGDCERSKGRNLRLIIHTSRYSDIRCYIWTASSTSKFASFAPPAHRWPIPGLEADGHNEDSPFIFVHPVVGLMDRSRNNLDDINLEARDCLALWKSMNKHQTLHYPLDATLNPDKFFSPTITKDDVVKWETELKKVLLRWLHDHKSPFLVVQGDLAPATTASHPDSTTKKTVLSLLFDIQKRSGLPALLFSYDRTNCMKTVGSIVDQLHKYEDNYKMSDSEWAKTLADYEKYQEEKVYAERKAASVRKKAFKKTKNGRFSDDRDGNGDPDDRGPANLRMMKPEASRWDSFDPDAPLDQFSLANHAKMTRSELNGYIAQLGFADLPPYIIEGLQRGVAVHHGGMNRKYRQTVEVLFRKGFLTAVVATGTLALGINMPCKTVVFLGDSTYLTALNYRQCSGRAGRRGFDILGNVVFYDLPLQRVKELMSSRLSDLRGHYPISTSLVLRTSTLLHQTNRCEFAQQCARSLFSQTRVYLGGPEGKEAIKHHLRFSIEYLQRNQLLSTDGAPVYHAALVSHLYHTEDAVFAFHALLKDGYFHQLCSRMREDQDGVLTTLMLVLAHIFQRHPCRRYKDVEWLENTVRLSSSVVLLPPLPGEAKRILQEHNSKTLSIFRMYTQSYIREHLADKPDDTLPFTDQKIGPTEEAACVALQPWQRPVVEIRSPFAALSGFDDEFQSIHELCSTVRAGVFLEELSAPYLAVYPDDTNGVPFNAYLYDFFRHGDVTALVKGNGVKGSDVWFLLQDFSLTLATIVTGLQNMVGPSSAGMDGNDPSDTPSNDSDSNEDYGYDIGAVPITSWSPHGDASTGMVLKAFAQLKTIFDEKFKKMWA